MFSRRAYNELRINAGDWYRPKREREREGGGRFRGSRIRLAVSDVIRPRKRAFTFVYSGFTRGNARVAITRRRELADGGTGGRQGREEQEGKRYTRVAGSAICFPR